jgi:hypothetical protein
VLIPVNPCEAHAEPFAQIVGVRAMELGMGVIGMKVLSRGLLVNVPSAPSVQELLHYALTEPIHVAIVGCDTVEQVTENAAAARKFRPMEPHEQRALEDRFQSQSQTMLYYRPPTLRA